jgi:hypothetical protein
MSGFATTISRHPQLDRSTNYLVRKLHELQSDDAGDRSRTCGPRITNALLYQLSYSGAQRRYVKHHGRAAPEGL